VHRPKRKRCGTCKSYEGDRTPCVGAEGTCLLANEEVEADDDGGCCNWKQRRAPRRMIVGIGPANREFWSGTPGELMVLECGHRTPRPPESEPKRNVGDKAVCRECAGFKLWWTRGSCSRPASIDTEN